MSFASAVRLRCSDGSAARIPVRLSPKVLGQQDSFVWGGVAHDLRPGLTVTAEMTANLVSPWNGVIRVTSTRSRAVTTSCAAEVPLRLRAER